MSRPCKNPTDKLHRIESWVDITLWEWIRKSGGSAFVRRLLQKAYEERR